MQDETTPPENLQDPAAEPVVETPVEPSMDDLKVQLQELQNKADENWERYLRATAEQDNIRKRSEREIDAARRFAVEKFAQDLLGVRDSLEMGLKAATAAGVDATQMEGMELTLKMLSEAFGRHGLKAIDPKGEPFDPARHEAISAVPSSDTAPNTVLDVMQKGYSLNDRVLRPAMVIVAKALPENPA